MLVRAALACEVSRDAGWAHGQVLQTTQHEPQVRSHVLWERSLGTTPTCEAS
jgi:hypothetical protein